MAVTFELDGAPEAVGKARHAVENAASRWVTGETLETTRLLVSEIVTNGIVHGGGGQPLEISVCGTDGELRVEVRDFGPGFVPQPGAMGSERAGFGLFLVERLADRWGVARDGRTRVWFELSQSSEQ